MPHAATIRIAAAIIDDGNGRMLLVRKTGTRWFMQAGGKVETNESPAEALCRELRDEIGLTIEPAIARYLGPFTAAAANEKGRMIEAELFHVRLAFEPTPGLEIAEAIWVNTVTAYTIPLARLTRDHILPLFATLAA